MTLPTKTLAHVIQTVTPWPSSAPMPPATRTSTPPSHHSTAPTSNLPKTSTHLMRRKRPLPYSRLKYNSHIPS